jgi:hypothetical protein
VKSQSLGPKNRQLLELEASHVTDFKGLPEITKNVLAPENTR